MEDWTLEVHLESISSNLEVYLDPDLQAALYNEAIRLLELIMTRT